MQLSKSNKGSATRQRPITQSQLSALSSHLERSAPPGVIVDIKFLKEKMAAAVKGKSLPEDDHVAHLLEDMHRLFKTKGISMEAVFPTAGVELSTRDFLDAHETLTRCGQETRSRTHSASSFKRSLGLSNIPTPLRSRSAGGTNPKDSRNNGDSILYKPRHTFGGMSPMEALLGVRTGEKIDPALLGASRRASRRLSMNPVTYNPERQDQLQTVYDYLKANRGSPVMSRIMGHTNGEIGSKSRSKLRRPKTAPSAANAVAFSATTAATGAEPCGGTEDNNTPAAGAQAVLGTSNASAHQEGETYRNLTFVHHGSKSAWSMREAEAAERGPATDDATSEAGGGWNRRNQVTQAFGPLGIYDVKTKDLMYLRAVIQPSAQLWLVAKGVYTLLQSHQHEARDEAVRDESLGAAAVRFSGGAKTYSQKGLFGGHRHGAFAATAKLFTKEDKVPDFTWELWKQELLSPREFLAKLESIHHYVIEASLPPSVLERIHAIVSRDILSPELIARHSLAALHLFQYLLNVRDTAYVTAGPVDGDDARNRLPQVLGAAVPGAATADAAGPGEKAKPNRPVPGKERREIMFSQLEQAAGMAETAVGPAQAATLEQEAVPTVGELWAAGDERGEGGAQEAMDYDFECKVLAAARTNRTTVHRKSLCDKRIYMVAVDGSRGAHHAFKCALAMATGPFDKIVVIHSFSAKQLAFLATERRPDNIRMRYRAELSDSPLDNAIMIEERPDGVTTKEHVCFLANANKVDLLVVGFTQEHSSRDHARNGHILGSMVDLSMRRAFCTTVIVKPTSVLRQNFGASDSQHCLVFVDGTDEAEEAYRVADSHVCAGDRLTVLHLLDVHQQPYLSTTKQWVHIREHYRTEYGVAVQQVVKDPGRSITQHILEHAALLQPNFLVIGVDLIEEWQSTKVLHSSLSDAIVEGNKGTSRINIICSCLKTEKFLDFADKALRVPCLA